MLVVGVFWFFILYKWGIDFVMTLTANLVVNPELLDYDGSTHKIITALVWLLTYGFFIYTIKNKE